MIRLVGDVAGVEFDAESGFIPAQFRSASRRVYPGAIPVSEPAGLSRRNSGQRAGGFIPAQR